MESRPSRPSTLSRRRFLEVTGGAIALTATGSCASAPAPVASAGLSPARTYSKDSFDPWIEIDRNAYRHNVREASRLAGRRPILAVVKNNAYGLGDRAVGPLLADFPEVGGIACVRIEEAIAMRDAGVTKPIVVMAEGSEEEIEELVHHEVLPTVWLDDAPRRLERVARRLGRPVPIQIFLDTGREGKGCRSIEPSPGWRSWAGVRPWR